MSFEKPKTVFVFSTQIRLPKVYFRLNITDFCDLLLVGRKFVITHGHWILSFIAFKIYN